MTNPNENRFGHPSMPCATRLGLAVSCEQSFLALVGHWSLVECNGLSGFQDGLALT